MAVTLDGKIKILAHSRGNFALNCAAHVLGDDVVGGCKPQSADAFSSITEMKGDLVSIPDNI